MYTKYFGFSEKPFNLTPNPRYLYLSKHHREAFAHLLYGINNRYGFIALTGEIGTGKTTVLRTLLGQLKADQYRTALIFNPCLSGVELLQTINHEFGIPSRSDQINELLAALNHFLLEENRASRTVVLVIDEAQNLKPEVLEQLRLISNLETESDKLIQIVIVGQPELDELLQRQELRQLNQRIAVRYRLRPMSLKETFDYIIYRMEVAGNAGGAEITKSALKLIYLNTGGVPRLINIFGDRCLLIAYGQEQHKITARIATKACGELLNMPDSSAISVRGLLIGVALGLILLLGVMLYYVKLTGGTP